MQVQQRSQPNLVTTWTRAGKVYPSEEALLKDVALKSPVEAWLDPLQSQVSSRTFNPRPYSAAFAACATLKGGAVGGLVGAGLGYGASLLASVSMRTSCAVAVLMGILGAWLAFDSDHHEQTFEARTVGYISQENGRPKYTYYVPGDPDTYWFLRRDFGPTPGSGAPSA